jgi:cell division transport system permease protein
MRLGLLSSILALIGLSFLLWEIDKRFPELEMFQQQNELTVIFISILTLGIGITGLSTFFATQRYLKLKTNAVY